MTARKSSSVLPGKQPKRLARQERVQAESSMSRRELNRRDKLARIAEASRTLFRRKGFEATTTQEIAERAGIASGTLFLYVDTKEDLLIMAFASEILEVMEHVCASTPPRAGLAEQALHFFEGMFAYHAEDIDLTRHLMRELAFVRNPQRRAEVAQVADAAHGRLASMIERAQLEGTIELASEPKWVAMDLFALFFSPMSAWLNEFITRDAYIHGLRRAVTTMVAGLAPRVLASPKGARQRKSG